MMLINQVYSVFGMLIVFIVQNIIYLYYVIRF